MLQMIVFKIEKARPDYNPQNFVFYNQIKGFPEVEKDFKEPDMRVQFSNQSKFEESLCLGGVL